MKNVITWSVGVVSTWRIRITAFCLLLKVVQSVNKRWRHLQLKPALKQRRLIKAAETRVTNASLDMEKAYEEQRAKIQSKFKKVSLSLYHVNVNFIFKVLLIG